MAVGGTAAAIYARQPVSLDMDFLSPYLRERFEEVESALREIPGFSFARLYQGLTAAGALTAFAEAAHDNLADSSDVDLRQWRALRAEYQDLNRVRSVCEQFALNVIESQAAT